MPIVGQKDISDARADSVEACFGPGANRCIGFSSHRSTSRNPARGRAERGSLLPQPGMAPNVVQGEANELGPGSLGPLRLLRSSMSDGRLHDGGAVIGGARHEGDCRSFLGDPVEAGNLRERAAKNPGTGAARSLRMSRIAVFQSILRWRDIGAPCCFIQCQIICLT